MAEPTDGFDLILAGTGFASTFFLHRYLQRAPGQVRVLVLERGARREHAWQRMNEAQLDADVQGSFRNLTPSKPWNFRLAFGGGSNCWWACTPRFLPEDFELRSRYGIGQDWPITYNDLEEYYCDAEEIMAVSGPSDGSPAPRSRPYPLPPHRLTDPDRILKRHYPDLFFNQPTARPSRPLPSGRPRCCASGVCKACPINSKFTILNELDHLYSDPRVTLLTEATVLAVECSGAVATAVRYRRGGGEHSARGETIGLGTNALFNAHILLRSGLDGPAVGRGLAEQVSANVDISLDGLDNFQGSTSITGHGYMLYGGEHRRQRAAALIETRNIPLLRIERGKWRQRLIMKVIYEELRRPESYVAFNPRHPDTPEVHDGGRSDYLLRGLTSLPSQLPALLAPLPVTEIKVGVDVSTTESHILGTTAMGQDPATSVVDRELIHHRVRNLRVLGSSVFPTVPPANPTLTLCALSLFSADRLFDAR